MNTYYVAITETLTRSVLIEAEDAVEAEERAYELCNNGDINLTYEDFDTRNATASIVNGGDYSHLEKFPYPVDDNDDEDDEGDDDYDE